MLTLKHNTIAVEVCRESYQEVICDLPSGMEAVYDNGDAYLVESAKRGPNEEYLRADAALKVGLISFAEVINDRNLVVKLRTHTRSWVICDVPDRYLVGCDAGKLYLMEKNDNEVQPQKWPVIGLLTVNDALDRSLIQARPETPSLMREMQQWSI